MVRLKAAIQLRRFFGLCSAVASLAAITAFSLSASAQQDKPAAKPAARIITIVMADGKTGKTLTPDNFVIRFNHLNAIRNETLVLDDDGSGKVKVPANATLISVQGTYHNSIDLYVNCDAGMEKDTSTLHWYSIADIVSTGVAAPNECYKGKYAKSAAIPPVPGEFIFYVREIGWHDLHSE
jgi:hypothetical protein